ncbi:MAG: FKBP-type peptidyl-prolyl cis-trans isomerase [Chitinophagaceae bacterium]|nr:FKBP-type peptidyl-prolyl cis-trans isomerase [Chitinophagaceae bacterium]
MKKLLMFCVLGVITVSFYSCLKADASGCPYKETTIKAPDAEVLKVKEYLDGKGINALKDSSGVYYIVTNSGSGTVTPEVCSTISINYTGKLTTDSVFDKTDGTPIVLKLGSLIPGWIAGLKHIKGGGQIKLYIPPSLAYGSVGATRTDQNGNTVVVIPPNAILIFDVELVAVQ